MPLPNMPGSQESLPKAEVEKEKKGMENESDLFLYKNNCKPLPLRDPEQYLSASLEGHLLPEGEGTNLLQRDLGSACWRSHTAHNQNVL